MNEKEIGLLKSSPVIKRYGNNPILTAKDVPYKADFVFNSSVIKYEGKYVMVFRDDYYGENGKLKRIFGTALSNDGIHFDVQPEPFFDLYTEEFKGAYDPRLVELEGKIYMTFTVATPYGCRTATALIKDFKEYEIIEMAPPCSRNTLLFPEKIQGKYYRLERPFWEGPDACSNVTGVWWGKYFNLYVSSSPDLIHWGNHKMVLSVGDVDYANIKVGGGPVPVKTPKGWLVLTHGVDFDPARGKNGTENLWRQRYSMGVLLLDLEDPTKVIGFSKDPLMAPEAEYEINNGFRNNVIFPTAAIVEDNGEVKIYYGAADAVTCLATANVNDLIDLCLKG